jgi:putative ABC transport system permease protein
MEQRLDDEIRFHVDMQTGKNLRAGMAPDEARAAALRSFGGRDRWTEAARDEYRSRPLEDFVKDLRHAARSLRRNPVFGTVTVLTLAIGIGATTAIFSAVDAYLLRPLPFPQSERLVVLWDTQGETSAPASLPEFDDWRLGSRTVAPMAAFFQRAVTIRGTTDAERVRAALISADYFDLLGVKPIVGRVFLPAEHAEGAPPVAVVSRGFWEQQLGGRRDALGQTITFDERAYTLVGVIAGALEMGAQRTAIWVPLERNTIWRNRGTHYLTVVGRLREPMTLAAVRSDLAALAKRLDETHRSGHGATASSLREEVVGGGRQPLLVLLAAVGFVLLIAMANVAGLLQARAAARAHEIAVRRALGAGRGRLFRQSLTEAVLLAALGGTAGIGIAVLGTRFLVAQWPTDAPQLTGVGVDLRVLAFVIGVSALAAIVAAIAPGLPGTRATLGERSASSAGGRRGVRSILVAGEVALTMVLLVGAGLTMRSLDRLLQTNVGFDPESVLTLRVALPATRYEEDAKQRAFFDALLERVGSHPGVTAAGAVLNLPLNGGSMNGDFGIEGRPEFRPGDAPTAEKHLVTPDYFRAMRIRLVRGRLFTAQDREGSRQVAIINESMARRFWPNADPIGERMRILGDSTDWQEIVGIVADVRHQALDRGVGLETYVPFAQFPSEGMTLVVRSTLPTSTLTVAVRNDVRAIDASIPVFAIKWLDEVVAESARARRTPAALLGLFAVIALLLAAVGLYGLLAFSVSQRAHEMGVRMAVGAERRDVIRLVLGEGMRLVGAGAVIGTLLAMALGRVVAALLYETSPFDVASFGVAALVLIGTAALACWAPAHRAAGVDPVRVMRGQ